MRSHLLEEHAYALVRGPWHVWHSHRSLFIVKCTFPCYCHKSQREVGTEGLRQPLKHAPPNPI